MSKMSPFYLFLNNYEKSTNFNIFLVCNILKKLEIRKL